MRFASASLDGVFVLEPERAEDPRGYFARTWCSREFAAQGLPTAIVQSSISYNRQAGTVRGLHFQWPPSAEGKLVRCERGAVHDVMLDLRPDSGTFLRHVAVRLQADVGNAVYIPPGVAHGFQTLTDEAIVYYMMTDYYEPDLAAGVRYDDPAFGITWPLPVAVISDRDRNYPDVDVAAHTRRFRGAAP